MPDKAGHRRPTRPVSRHADGSAQAAWLPGSRRYPEALVAGLSRLPLSLGCIE